MQIQRLSWAGIRITFAETSVVVGLLENTAPLEPSWGEPLTEIVPLEEERAVQVALVTHMHPDHYDPAALRRRLAPGGKVVCHRAIEPKIAAFRVDPGSDRRHISGLDKADASVVA